MTTASAPPTSSTGTRATPSDRAFAFGLALIALAALALRLVVTLVAHGTGPIPLADGDAFYYSVVANALAHGHWFTNPYLGSVAADHPPLTALVLTPATWVFGAGFAQRCTTIVIGTLTVVTLGAFGRRIGGPAVGLTAAALAALGPSLWINDGLVMSESIVALLTVGILASGVGLAREPGMRRAVVTGLLVGFAVLARAELVLFLPFMVVPIGLVAPVPWRRRLVVIVAAGLACAVVVAPWTLWVSDQFGRTVWVSTNAGATLAGSNCAETYAGPLLGGWTLTCAAVATRPHVDAATNSAHGVDAGLRYMRHHVTRLPVVMLARAGRTLGVWAPSSTIEGEASEGRPRGASWAAFVTFWVLLPFAARGLWLLRRRGDVSVWPFVATAVVAVGASMAFLGNPRYRLPLDVTMCVLAAVAIGPWIEAHLGRRAAPRPGGATT
ncbi:MAG: ArnT family glycosyltransferase [Acidimicrobiia bacterium]